jgi:hypothetical protein
MSDTFLKWFLGGALLVGSLHVGETFRLIFDSPSVVSAEMYVVTPIEVAAERRS